MGFFTAITIAGLGLSAWGAYQDYLSGKQAEKQAKEQQALNDFMARSTLRLDYKENLATMEWLEKYLSGTGEGPSLKSTQELQRLNLKNELMTRFTGAAQELAGLKVQEGMADLRAAALGVVGGRTSAGLLGEKLEQERITFATTMAEYFGTTEGFSTNVLEAGGYGESYVGKLWKDLVDTQKEEETRLKKQLDIIKEANEEYIEQYEKLGGYTKKGLKNKTFTIEGPDGKDRTVNVLDWLKEKGVNIEDELLSEEEIKKANDVIEELKGLEREWGKKKLRESQKEEPEGDTGQGGEGLPIAPVETDSSYDTYEAGMGDYGSWGTDDFEWT